MGDDGALRASDEDRERLVTVLREQMIAGRLTSEELDERAGAAYAAKTWGDLRALVRDLPVTVVFADERAPVPAARPAPARPVFRAPARARRPSPLLPIAVAFLVILIISDRLLFLIPILVFAVIVTIITVRTPRRGRRL